MGLFWKDMNSLQPRMLCVKFGRNWPSGSGKVEFLIVNVSQYLYNSVIIWVCYAKIVVRVLTHRVWSFLWTNFNPLHPRMLCGNYVCWIWPRVLEEKILNCRKGIFAFISPWKRAGPFFTNLNTLHTYALWKRKKSIAYIQL